MSGPQYVLDEFGRQVSASSVSDGGARAATGRDGGEAQRGDARWGRDDVERRREPPSNRSAEWDRSRDRGYDRDRDRYQDRDRNRDRDHDRDRYRDHDRNRDRSRDYAPRYQDDGRDRRRDLDRERGRRVPGRDSRYERSRDWDRRSGGYNNRGHDGRRYGGDRERRGGRDRYRSRSRSRSPPGALQVYPRPRRNNDDAPTKPMSYKDFLLRQPDDIMPQEASRAYDNYRRDHALKFELGRWFHANRNSDWMNERYNPQFRRDFRNKMQRSASSRANRLLELTQAGRSHEAGISVLNRSGAAMVAAKTATPTDAPKNQGASAAAEEGDANSTSTSSAEPQQPSRDSTDRENRAIIFVQGVPGWANLAVIQNCVERAESKALEGLYSETPEAQHDELRSIVESRTLMLAQQSSRRKSRNRRNRRPPMRVLRLNYRKLGDPLFPLVESVAAAVKSALQGISWKPDAPKPRNEAEMKQLTVQSVSYHHYRRPLRVPQLDASNCATVFTPARVAYDIEQAMRLARALDMDLGLSSVENHPSLENYLEAAGSNEEDPLDLLQRLEIILSYLLHVHNYNYLLGLRYPDMGIRFEQMGNAGVDWSFAAGLPDFPVTAEPARGPPSQVTRVIDEAAQAVINACSDDKIAERAATLSKQLTQLSDAIDDGLEDLVERSHVIEENGVRCMIAPPGEKCKLFKAKSFLKKHILSKHPEHARTAKAESIREFVKKAYMRDPDKIMPPHMRRNNGRAGAGAMPPALDRASGAAAGQNAQGAAANAGAPAPPRNAFRDPRAQRLTSYGDIDALDDEDDNMDYER